MVKRAVRDDPFGELNRAITRLALMSQVSAAAVGNSTPSADEDIGGKRPPGGIAWKDDREPDFQQKSVEHFRRRLARCDSPVAARALLADVEAALAAWQRTPIPQGQEPEFGSPQWKRYIAESSEDGGTLARKFRVTRQYIHSVRKAYAGKRALSSGRDVRASTIM